MLPAGFEPALRRRRRRILDRTRLRERPSRRRPRGDPPPNQCWCGPARLAAGPPGRAPSVGSPGRGPLERVRGVGMAGKVLGPSLARGGVDSVLANLTGVVGDPFEVPSDE
jgi:hypothetical protein